MKLNYYFQKIYCINLDRRPDRWDRCVEIFNQYGITADRISAVDGQTIGPEKESTLSNGEIGCIKSHMLALNNMIDSNIENALILEDDIEFTAGWEHQFEMAVGNLPKWDMLYLGCNHVVKPVHFQSNIVRIVKGYTTSSYAIKLDFAKRILPNISKLDKQIDVHYALHHRTHPCYAIKPAICFQRADHSDIQDGHTDYTQYFT